MKLKSALRYQAHEFIRPIVIYYIVIAALMLVAATMVSIVSSDDGTVLSGFEAATAIFLFVCGLNSFKPTFRLFLQNGLSRRTLFVSFGITAAAVSLTMALLDCVVTRITAAFFNGNTLLAPYAPWVGENNPVAFFFVGLLILFALYLAAMFLGYFITSLYYRMNKLAKIIVSVTIPAIFWMLLPLADFMLFHNALSRLLNSALAFVIGQSHGFNPFFPILSSLVLAVVSAALAWMLGRRAVAKE